MLSQNGATVILNAKGVADYGNENLVTNPIPGTLDVKYLGGLLKGDVDVVLRYVGAYWNKHIEPVTDFWHKGEGRWYRQNWGYEPRAIRAGEEWSNHSSGTACDTNSGEHPLGTRTLTGPQLSELLKLTIRLRGIVRFGAFYQGRPDEMHAEVVIFDERLRRLADDIRNGRMAEDNFPELMVAHVAAKPQTQTSSKPAAPADWWDTVDEATVRKIVSEETAKAIRAEGASGAGDAGRLSGILRDALVPVLRSEGVSGAADTGALVARLVPALRAAGIVAIDVDDAHIRSVIAQAVAS